jgi:CRP-like cAMP-binding protein
MRKQTKDSFDPKLFLAKVGAGKTILEFHKNRVIFAQGDVADTVLYIQKGRVKLTVMSEHSKEAVVAILEPVHFFGEGCLNGQPLRLAATTAMEECLITSITKEAMISLLHAEPKFSELFMAYLLTRNSRIEEDLVDQLFNSSEKRLGAPSPFARSLREGRQPAANQSKHQPGNVGGDDRHHPFPRQLFHEQIPQTGSHQLQRKNRSSQLAFECSSARQARDKTG